MNILVVGCGKVGARLAMRLQEDEHDVSIIARSNAEAEKQLDAAFSGSLLCGVPIDQDNLKKAGMETCDVCCAVTDDDNTNIMVAQLAKEVYGVKKVISRVMDPERGDIFAHFGLETVCPTRLTVEAICSALKPVPEDKYLNFGSHSVKFFYMDVPKEFVDCTPDDIEYEEHEALYAVISADGNMRLANGVKADGRLIIFKEGDRLIFTKMI